MYTTPLESQEKLIASIPTRDGTCLKGLVQSHSKGSDGSGPQALLSGALPVRVLAILCSSPHGATCKYTAAAAGEYGATAEACTWEQMGVARDGQPSREPQHGRLLLQVVKLSIKAHRTIPGTIKHFALDIAILFFVYVFILNFM